MTERERCQVTVRWEHGTRAALDKSFVERPFSPSGSLVLPLLPPGEGNIRLYLWVFVLVIRNMIYFSIFVKKCQII